MCKDPIVEVWSSGYLVDKINRSWRLLKYRGRGKKGCLALASIQLMPSLGLWPWR